MSKQTAEWMVSRFLQGNRSAPATVGVGIISDFFETDWTRAREVHTT